VGGALVAWTTSTNAPRRKRRSSSVSTAPRWSHSSTSYRPSDWSNADLKAEDRRKNIVSLTSEGHTLILRGAQLLDGCERNFLVTLDASAAGQLKQALATAIAAGLQSSASE
jgi:hypothetical protein